jgi:hypothetical protein
MRGNCQCKRKVHERCLAKWLDAHYTCPWCRTPTAAVYVIVGTAGADAELFATVNALHKPQLGAAPTVSLVATPSLKVAEGGSAGTYRFLDLPEAFRDRIKASVGGGTIPMYECRRGAGDALTGTCRELASDLPSQKRSNQNRIEKFDPPGQAPKSRCARSRGSTSATVGSLLWSCLGSALAPNSSRGSSSSFYDVSRDDMRSQARSQTRGRRSGTSRSGAFTPHRGGGEMGGALTRSRHVTRSRRSSGSTPGSAARRRAC